MSRRSLRNNVFDQLLSKDVIAGIELSEVPKDKLNKAKKVPENGPENEIISDDVSTVRIVSLDETGTFEHLWNQDNPKNEFRCIGGVYVDLPIKTDGKINSDDISDRINVELRKIYNFFCDSIEEFNKSIRGYEVIMPDSLHLGDIALKDKTNGDIIPYWNNDKKDWNRDRYNIRKKFRRFIEEKTSRFVNDNHYKTYGYLLSMNQISIDDVNPSNIVDYRVGANLYEEMVIRAVENNLFYDVDKEVKNASVRMATKVFTPNKDEVGLYTLNKKGKGFVTNTNFIKTALMHKINDVSSLNKDINISFAVESIQYYKTDESQEELAFHYLSDIICGILKNKYMFGNNYGNGYDELSEQVLVDKSYELTDEGYSIRFMSEPDRMYNQMLECVYAGKLVDYYSIKYDFERRIIDKRPEIKLVSKYYYDKFLPELDNLLEERLSTDVGYQNMVISKLPELYAQNNAFMGYTNKYEKGRFIALNMCNVLEQVKDRIKSSRFCDMYSFRFIDIVIRGENHRGEISNLKPLLEKGEQYGYSVGVEEFLEHKQRAIQFYFNSMKYDQIIKEYYKNVIGSYVDGKWNFSDIENLISSMKAISGNQNQGILIVGKIKSSLAQALAFERMPNAEIYFEEALKEMEGDKGNTRITLSYMLHHFIDMATKCNWEKYKEKYEKYAAEYFEVNPDSFTIELLEKLFVKIMNEINNYSEWRFALYLYIKSLKVFYYEQFKDSMDFRNLINKMGKEILEHAKSVNDMIHPWELIYKNLYEIMDEIGDATKNTFYKELIKKERMKNSGPTIWAIIIKFKLDYMDKYEISDDEYVEQLKDIEGLENIKDMSNDEVKKVLSDKLTYMYN